tara:strand:+ start:8067 stop:8762 length:696 start_codon:yes stop_codon:yes gene_type:complete
MAVCIPDLNSDARVITVYDSPQPVINIIKENDNIAAFTVIESGVAGRNGDDGAKGDKGDVGDSPPFFLISGTTNWATTSSIAFLSTISSSLLPATHISNTSNYNLGSTTNPWKSLYVGTGSIHFVDSTGIISTVSATNNSIYIGSSLISTSSYGFTNNPIIIDRSIGVDIVNTGSLELQTSNRDVLVIRSGSIVTHKIDNKGRLIFNNFNELPSSISGAIAHSGSSFYFGI